MRADGANLLRFLKKADQLVVPLYQRRYSWTESEWRQLWSDIMRVADDPDGPEHFIGSIVQIGGVVLSAGHNPLQLIDGQQRVTTVSLLLLALDRTARDRLERNPHDEDALVVANEQIPGFYLLDDREQGERRYKLLPNDADRGTYLALIEDKPLPDRPARNVLDAFRFFESQFSTSDRPLSELLHAVSRLLVVEIALERDRDDPQLIFESLNSTGLDLTQADLIRNYVLMGLPPGEQDELYRFGWHPMEERLTPVGPEGFDRFVRDYLTMRTGQIPRIDQIYRAFKEYVAASAETPTELAHDLHRFSDYYSKLVAGTEQDPRVRTALADIQTLKVEVAHPFLLDVLDDHAAGKITTDELVEVLRIVESYVFRRAVSGAPAAAMNKIFATLAREVDEERYLESLKAALLLKEGSGRLPRDEEFRRELLAKDIYSFRNRAYLFDKLENFGRKERVEVGNYTIEHVMPQNPELSPEWQEELGPDWARVQAEHLHTLGNLTLTGYNSELSDRPFADKMAMDGGFAESPIRLNESVRVHSQWTEDAITDRGRKLAELATRVWSAPRLPEDVIERYRSARQRVRHAYTLDDHPMLVGATLVLFEALQRRVNNLGPGVVEDIRKQVITYRAGRPFLSVVPLLNELKLYLAGLDPDQIDDPDGRARDVREVGHWGAGDIEVRLTSHDELDVVMHLVEQAFSASEDSAPEQEEYPTEAVERILELAVTWDEQQALRRLVEVAVSGGMYPRPWAKVIMLAPPQNRTMALLSVRVGNGGSIEFFCAEQNWEQYAAIPRARAEASLGPHEWTRLPGPTEINRLADSLEELLGDVTFPGKSRRPRWNGQDFYVILGDLSWEDCRRYGFVGASGGTVYTRPLERLFPGARVFAYYSSPTRGYVGIGTVREESKPIREFMVRVDGMDILLLDAPLTAREALTADSPDDPDVCSRLVRVDWAATVGVDEGIWESGLFANQMVVCRLRDANTRETLLDAFGLVDTQRELEPVARG